jgi:hypothetical protein
LLVLYNLHYTPTALSVPSRREVTAGVREQRFDRHCCRLVFGRPSVRIFTGTPVIVAEDFCLSLKRQDIHTMIVPQPLPCTCPPVHHPTTRRRVVCAQRHRRFPQYAHKRRASCWFPLLPGYEPRYPLVRKLHGLQICSDECVGGRRQSGPTDNRTPILPTSAILPSDCGDL